MYHAGLNNIHVYLASARYTANNISVQRPRGVNQVTDIVQILAGLSDAGFAPLQVQQPLDIALLLVKGMAADKFLF